MGKYEQTLVLKQNLAFERKNKCNRLYFSVSLKRRRRRRKWHFTHPLLSTGSKKTLPLTLCRCDSLLYLLMNEGPRDFISKNVFLQADSAGWVLCKARIKGEDELSSALYSRTGWERERCWGKGNVFNSRSSIRIIAAHGNNKNVGTAH